MMRARLGLVAAALLIGAWLVWLIITAWTSGEPVIISAPQFEIAPIAVEVRLEQHAGGNFRATIQRTVKGKEALIRLLGKPDPAGEVIELRADQHLAGWQGRGDYLLLLQRAPGAARALDWVPIPLSPGFTSRIEKRIYPLNDGVRRQYAALSNSP